MNRARLIAGLREVLAALEDDEQLEELVPPAPKSKPRKRRPRVRLVPPPSREPSPVALERARRLARREGLA